VLAVERRARMRLSAYVVTSMFVGCLVSVDASVPACERDAVVPLVPVAASGAAVSISASRVVVSSRRAAAIVDRDPFQLRIVAGSRATALSEVPNHRPGPTILPPTIDPVPPGTVAPESGQLYAPVVIPGRSGVDRPVQRGCAGRRSDERDSFGGFSTRRSTARKVIARRRLGSGALLTVSTDDPSRRTLGAEITLAGAGLIRVSVTPHPARGVVIISDSFASSRSEAFYGFGGPHTALDQHGAHVRASWDRRTLLGLAHRVLRRRSSTPTVRPRFSTRRRSSSHLGATGSCSRSHSLRGSGSTPIAQALGAWPCRRHR